MRPTSNQFLTRDDSLAQKPRNRYPGRAEIGAPDGGIVNDVGMTLRTECP